MKFDRKPCPGPEELRRMYEDDGMTMTAIGQVIGMTQASVWHRLRDAGIQSRSQATAMTRARLMDYIERGCSRNEIAKAEGVTPGAVTFQLKRHGLRAVDGRDRPKRRYERKDRVNFSGYWMMNRPDHPFADKRGRVMEHRLVVEARLGRYLRPEEVVHHMNHVKDDNRDENLMLLDDHRTHMKIHSPKGRPAAPGGNEARWGKRPI